VIHSLADISKAAKYLGYHPAVPVREGLGKTMRWYRENNTN
jgi:nucleoside-diphosphate-sugar epimerase